MKESNKEALRISYKLGLKKCYTQHNLGRGLKFTNFAKPKIWALEVH